MTDDDLKGLFDATAHAETRRHFEETVDRISTENRQYFEVATEAVKHQIDLLAKKVTGLSEELHRETAELRLEMRKGFAETQAMLRVRQ